MLFDPFFTSKEHGTGLGLSVTKQLTVSNGGDIRWKNAKEGGAVFTLSFPRAKGI
jgi:C4-dicarboxylate-specific signal transduction histidine kinase